MHALQRAARINYVISALLRLQNMVYGIVLDIARPQTTATANGS